MRITRLTGSLISPAVADIFINRKTEVVHHNLSHGTKSTGCWKWFAGLSHEHFDLANEPYTLDGDSYVLLPVKKNGLILKDAKGNVCYNIGIDSDPSHVNNILVLWTPAERAYSDVVVDVSGSCEIVGHGKNIANRTNRESSPAPVVEIYGDADLYWTGKRADGVVVCQHVKYNLGTKQWTFSDVTASED